MHMFRHASSPLGVLPLSPFSFGSDRRNEDFVALIRKDYSTEFMHAFARSSRDHDM